MHKPPVHCGGGFLGFNEPPKGWGDSHALTSLISSFNISSSISPAQSIKTEISDYALSPSYQFASSTQTVLLPSHLDALTTTYTLDPITPWLTSQLQRKSDQSWLLLRRNTEYCVGYRTILSPVLYHYLLTLWNSYLEFDSHRHAPMHSTSIPQTGFGPKS